jgi:putative cell wall-binding protein
MRRLLMVLLRSLVFLSFPGAAHAASVQPRDDSLVVLSGDAYVAARDTVNSVVAFSGL